MRDGIVVKTLISLIGWICQLPTVSMPCLLVGLCPLLFFFENNTEMFPADITPWKWENLQTHLGPLFLSNVSEMILLILKLNLQSLYEFNFQLCQHDFCQSKQKWGTLKQHMSRDCGTWDESIWPVGRNTTLILKASTRKEANATQSYSVFPFWWLQWCTITGVFLMFRQKYTWYDGLSTHPAGWDTYTDVKEQFGNISIQVHWYKPLWSIQLDGWLII